MNTSVKLQLNSLEALEKLIGGDTQLELELRSSIVQEFTKRHLKALADQAMIQQSIPVINSYIRAEFFNVTKQGYSTSSAFKQEVEGHIRLLVERQIQQTVTEIVEESIGNGNVREQIEQALQKAVRNIEQHLEPDVLKSRLERMVDAKIKDKLGLK